MRTGYMIDGGHSISAVNILEDNKLYYEVQKTTHTNGHSFRSSNPSVFLKYEDAQYSLFKLHFNRYFDTVELSNENIKYFLYQLNCIRTYPLEIMNSNGEVKEEIIKSFSQKEPQYFI